jgi:hypothetical protein
VSRGLLVGRKRSGDLIEPLDPVLLVLNAGRQRNGSGLDELDLTLSMGDEERCIGEPGDSGDLETTELFRVRSGGVSGQS